MTTATLLHRIRTQRFLLLAWVAVWLCGTVSLDVLHHDAHGHESTPHHSCAVCLYGHQPVQVCPALDATALIAPEYVELPYAAPVARSRPISAVPQQRNLRGPPTRFLFTMS